MNCIVELSEPKIRFDFVVNKYKQQIWIEALLKFSKLDINNIAEILELPVDMLIKVRHGSIFFQQDSAVQLASLFLIAFSD